MAMMDNRPDQSGDEEGKSQEGQLGKEINNTLVEAFVPNTVSQTQLQYMACKLRLKDVVEIQDFQKAAEIKNTMDHLESEEMKVLFSKVLHESKQMREQKERRRNKNDLTEDLEQAIAEEDFDLAQSIKDRMETASARSKSAASRLPLLRRIDMVWIESEIGSRILQARAREEERLKDPITRLEVNLKAALEEELFEEAAVIRDQLRSEHHDQDIRKMHRDLKRQLTFKAAELDRLKRNPVMYLSHQFQLAVNAEDYELAATLFKELTSAETRKMYEVLNKQVKSQEEKKMRRSKATQMENELDQSIAEEVIDTVVVALCLVATMAPLIWIGESVELALSLMNDATREFRVCATHEGEGTRAGGTDRIFGALSRMLAFPSIRKGCADAALARYLFVGLAVQVDQFPDRGIRLSHLRELTHTHSSPPS
eukprot:CAMPEP_0181304668 /NCGR_PEP_ID=MMETSP1101-20121128/9283_1 /TAXON_ID=46948 /ORGANISM="Rhodomonas abbreviata, Strain Caron Lab Isolate" /LENGTH=426 /DNA_ID=CAMNT_0023410461 /DNA_START=465 /DNA_END=1742 /DNA_ORIENTATION=-